MLAKALVMVAVVVSLGSAACSNNLPATAARAQEDDMNRQVTITGKAANAFLGAVVVDADGTVYFIDGLQEWDAELLDQQVVVTGTPTEKKLAPDPVVDDAGAVSHGMQGTSTVLVAPTWKRAP